jgi:hypothetical protein
MTLTKDDRAPPPGLILPLAASCSSSGRSPAHRGFEQVGGLQTNTPSGYIGLWSASASVEKARLPAPRSDNGQATFHALDDHMSRRRTTRCSPPIRRSRRDWWLRPSERLDGMT